LCCSISQWAGCGSHRDSEKKGGLGSEKVAKYLNIALGRHDQVPTQCDGCTMAPARHPSHHTPRLLFPMSNPQLRSIGAKPSMAPSLYDSFNQDILKQPTGRLQRTRQLPRQRLVARRRTGTQRYSMKAGRTSGTWANASVRPAVSSS
jgi:hypothetical protein